MRWPLRVLLIVGVVASIATSQVEGWSQPKQADISPFTLNDQASEIRYLIHTELRGPGPYEGLRGSVQVNVYMTAPIPSMPVMVELHGITHPELQTDTGNALVKGSATGMNVSVDAWLECVTDPCVEDFELIIRRTTTEPVEISGTMFVLTQGDDPDLPEGTEVNMTVMGPL